LRTSVSSRAGTKLSVAGSRVAMEMRLEAMMGKSVRHQAVGVMPRGPRMLISMWDVNLVEVRRETRMPAQSMETL
jgi:hypothetical protein